MSEVDKSVTEVWGDCEIVETDRKGRATQGVRVLRNPQHSSNHHARITGDEHARVRVVPHTHESARLTDLPACCGAEKRRLDRWPPPQRVREKRVETRATRNAGQASRESILSVWMQVTSTTARKETVKGRPRTLLG